MAERSAAYRARKRRRQPSGRRTPQNPRWRSSDETQVSEVLAKLRDRPICRIAVLALATDMRRSQLCGLQIGDVDLDAATVRIERRLGETSAGLRLKAPKTKHGRRTLKLPASAVTVPPTSLEAAPPNTGWCWALESHRHTLRCYGSPDNLSRDWRRVPKSLGLPSVVFHALYHTHASALIASDLDVVQVSRQLGMPRPPLRSGPTHTCSRGWTACLPTL
jgi:integrase